MHTIVPLFGMVLEGGRVDRNASCLFFRGLVDLAVLHILGVLLAGEYFGDGRRQGSLAVVDMSYCPH